MEMPTVSGRRGESFHNPLFFVMKQINANVRFMKLKLLAVLLLTYVDIVSDILVLRGFWE
jgi:hypothetical protein